VRNRIIEAVSRDDVASFAVAVAVDGEIVWQEGFGWADRERRIPATAHTIYPVASLSKPFTATGLMVLADRGRVLLDQPAESYLGDVRIRGYAADPQAATLTRVLQHRAGLPAHGQYFYTGEGAAPPSIEDTIERYGILVNEPGAYEYSNLGFGILAYISARVSGCSYPEFMRREVFEPLGLTHTSIQIGAAPTVATAVSYAADYSPLPYYVFDEWGSGRVYSSVHDLVRFGLFHLKEPQSGMRKILSDQAIDAMVQERESTGSAAGVCGPDWFYALGWGGREKTQFGPYWYGHDGAMPGVSAVMKLLPDERIVVATVSNKRSALPAAIADGIIDALLPEQAAARARDPALKPLPAPGQFALDAGLVGAWEGDVRTWEGRIPVGLRITADSKAYFRLGEEQEVVIEHVAFADGRFTGRAAGTLPTADVRPEAHHLEFDLVLRKNCLEGSITVAAEPPMYRFYLSSWMAVTRQ
jgi:CubicO group peptidase (beta-lactamase class C family)